MAAAMAANRLKTMCPFVAIFLMSVCFLFPNNGLCKERPSKAHVQKWAKQIDKDLQNINILYDIIKHPYETAAKGLHLPSSVSMKYKDVDVTKLVEEMADTLSEILRRKMEALKKSVDEAEIIAKEYPSKRELEIADVSYYNSKAMNIPGTPMEFSERFGKDVNFNFSSVHIPVEIYEGSNDILNGLNWTDGLDAQFKENYENDPDILWQYFGSQSGFMRTYPATSWNLDGVDLYDVRRQSWYTQGSSSPKDMLILIDTSGSTYGQSLQLMKNAVKSILNTLGENDFVNVVEFSETAKFVSKCFNHTAFVQANFRNKKQLERDVDKLSALGQADFSVAIRFAFEKFIEFSRNETNDENNIGANCNKVIMLLTDGGTDNAEDVFKEFNWPNKSVRVFTYAVGPTPNPIHAVRWMACANRGYFSQIPAMGAIRSRVQDYVRVLERPLAVAQAEHALWSSSHRSIYYATDQWLTYTENLQKPLELETPKHFYWELTFDPREYIPVLSRPQVIKNKKSFEWGNIYEDHGGLGMMTTVTLPVYNHTAGSSNQTILGVMGVDVTTAQLEAHTPFSKIGPNGYAFAINPNGYVVFHPNLKTLGKFMKEPPNIDLLELEVGGDTPDLVELRTNMIRGDTDKNTLYSYYLSPDQRYVSYGQATYAYINITNTTFRLGISVPIYQKQFPEFSGNLNKLQWHYNNQFVILIAPWNYHKDMEKMTGLEGNLNDIINLLNSDKNPNNYNLDLLYHLYWDVSLMDTHSSALKLINNTFNFDDTDIEPDERDVRAAFVMTNGGMTMVSPASEADYFHKMRDLRKSSLYTRTLYSVSSVLMADHIIAKRSNSSSPPYINIARAILITDNNSHQQKPVIDKPAVAGVRVSHDHIMRIVHNSVGNASIGLNVMTCRDTSLICYLVDDGGFLIASSGEDARQQVGRFFGLVDPPLMNALNETVFDRTVQYDFQAACKQEKDTISSGFKSFSVPSINLISELLTTGFWTSKVSWAFSSFNFLNWLFTPSTEVMAENEESDDKECVKSIQQYYWKRSVSSYAGGFQCENCTRNFTVEWLKSTNVLFIVSDPLCEECEGIYPPVGQAPREITADEEEEIICQLAQNPRKRVQAYGCYHSDSSEDQTECGCACLQFSPLVLLCTVSLLVWQRMFSIL